MDLPRLISLLEKRCLFFARVSVLNDPFEGHYPKRTSEKVQAARRQGMAAMFEQLERAGGSTLREKFETASSRTPTAEQFFRDAVCVNCWHLSEYESAAMWSQYTVRGQGVALVSTYSKLRDSFSTVGTDIHIGTVAYIDYETDEVPVQNGMHPFLHKRRSFEHERELRALLFDLGGLPHDVRPSDFEELERIPQGVYVPIDVGQLVEGVRLAPQTEPWFADVVRGVLIKYGITPVQVDQPDLDSGPSW